MRVIEPYQLRVPQKTKRKHRIKHLMTIFLVVVLAGTLTLGAWTYNQPLPNIVPKVVTVDSKGAAVALPWPIYGQASIGAKGYGVLESTANQKPAPTASVAKIMTAYAVLKAKPLSLSDQGPTINLGDADEELYNHYVSIQGSVVPVASGEQISQRQALEAVLMPSANNIADSLAIWAFGSIKNYNKYANKLAKDLGLKDTTITSASGFDANTVSTAADLVKLGLKALERPVIAEIVAKRQTTIPIVGNVYSTNIMLGRKGVIGIKTGNTDEAGGCYLVAAVRKIGNGQKITFVGAVMGADNLSKAMGDSLSLIEAGTNNFVPRKLISKGDKLAYYDAPWGGQTAAIANSDLSVWAWKSSIIKAAINADTTTGGTSAGFKVGSVESSGRTVDLVLADDINLPSRTWRLWRRN